MARSTPSTVTSRAFGRRPGARRARERRVRTGGAGRPRRPAPLAAYSSQNAEPRFPLGQTRRQRPAPARAAAACCRGDVASCRSVNPLPPSAHSRSIGPTAPERWRQPHVEADGVGRGGDRAGARGQERGLARAGRPVEQRGGRPAGGQRLVQHGVDPVDQLAPAGQGDRRRAAVLRVGFRVLVALRPSGRRGGGAPGAARGQDHRVHARPRNGEAQDRPADLATWAIRPDGFTAHRAADDGVQHGAPYFPSFTGSLSDSSFTA